MTQSVVVSMRMIKGLVIILDRSHSLTMKVWK